MAVIVENPRRTRLILALAGLAVAVLGGILWLIGDDNHVQGSNSMVVHSAAAWGDVLGYSTDEDAEMAAAQDQYDTGETQMTVGIVLAIAGLAVFGSRWRIPPTTEKC
ncbi:hypothetical protein ACGF0K_32385 [Streptomyces sp. NPDC048156]|uniref:hypothetical protein n=1 Tax=Streptomyces sp. NPDC048156 TaxID=3365502 RepID=UPI00370FEA68